MQLPNVSCEFVAHDLGFGGSAVDEQHDAVIEEYTKKVADAWKEARTHGTMTEGPFLDPVEMFDDVYAELPAHLEKQRREMLELENGGS